MKAKMKTKMKMEMTKMQMKVGRKDDGGRGDEDSMGVRAGGRGAMDVSQRTAISSRQRRKHIT